MLLVDKPITEYCFWKLDSSELLPTKSLIALSKVLLSTDFGLFLVQKLVMFLTMLLGCKLVMVLLDMLIYEKATIAIKISITPKN